MGEETLAILSAERKPMIQRELHDSKGDSKTPLQITKNCSTAAAALQRLVTSLLRMTPMTRMGMLRNLKSVDFKSRTSSTCQKNVSAKRIKPMLRYNVNAGQEQLKMLQILKNSSVKPSQSKNL